MNNYENAEPKILKTLNSSGEVLDDSGNVIADTSDYWVKTYNQAEPKPDKILHSDGTINENPTSTEKGYAWIDTQDNVAYFNFDESPEDDTSFEASKLLSIDFDTKLNGISIIEASTITNYESYTKNSDTEFEIVVNGVTHTYTRDDSKDFELWKI